MICPICDDHKAWRGGSCKRCRAFEWVCYLGGAIFALWLLELIWNWEEA